MAQHEWWKGAVIYQIYPRSFKDTNDDGIGDLQGIIAQLDYIKSLGVDAIWISPFFKSPMHDFGYDISDYCDVDPMFGSLADFELLVEQAHQLDIKIIIDQVLSHTSNQHEWFIQSRENMTNDKADWYVWADAKPDGSPPNNWLSIFGGSAWHWEPRRCQYYLHNFLTEQPDLNFHNQQVREAVLANMEFWLKKGVDGFRLDAINFCFHDAKLRDNPAKPKALRQGRGFSEDNPYAFQYHHYNNTQPENLKFMEEIRTLLSRYPGAVSLGEISSEDSLKTMAEYTSDNNKLHMGYSFELLTDDYSAQYIRETVLKLEQEMQQGWPCWAFSNHDVERVASRWHPDNHTDPRQAAMLSALLGSLRGSICVYQGEELGLPEAEVDFNDLQDPYGITFWPNFKGRDGCRTPMPWTNDIPFSGFSASKPWLPISKTHREQSVEQQLSNDNSNLLLFSRFMSWRKSMPTLQFGDIEFICSTDPVLAFYRTYQNRRTLCAFNLNEIEQTCSISLPTHSAYTSLPHHTGQYSEGIITLPAYGCFFCEIN